MIIQTRAVRILSATLIAFSIHMAGAEAGTSTYYVSTNGMTGAAGTNWATALNNIQEAVNMTADGDAVIVSNGFYDVGGRHANPLYTLDQSNRVAITLGITVRSVNGRDVTTIKGRPGFGNYLRCAYVGSNATLVGFTLTGGESIPANAAIDKVAGGAVFCESGAVVSNCTISGSYAHRYGGGVYQGTLINCLIEYNTAGDLGGGTYQSTLINCDVISNSAYRGAGTYQSTLDNCTLFGNGQCFEGGGAYLGTLNNCVITNNSATKGGGVFGNDAASGPYLTNCILTGNSALGIGGGAHGGTLNNCVLVDNDSVNEGGGAYMSALYNCLLAGNTAQTAGGGAYQALVNGCTVYENSANVGGGIYFCNSTKNSIIYSNSASSGPNYSSSFMTDCCTTPYSGGNMAGTIITNDPQLVDVATGNYRLSPTSPCIDTGSNEWATGATDLDGNARIVNAIVDMGAYEFQGVVVSDADGDGSSDAEEAVAGTNAGDSNSYWRVSGLMNTSSLRFDSVTGRLYSAEYSQSLAATPQVWTQLTNNIAGTGNPITIQDAGAATNRYYRVWVKLAP